ncbi:Uncharacterised protein [Raoultella terrigena]|uniref:Uncharacterized protein n=1 Tax=Raoultella terrigena TaxID=577 RepID=A0A3P8M041_RAOTE|nr:Uncharacterised protein [Raoultella terrigena]
MPAPIKILKACGVKFADKHDLLDQPERRQSAEGIAGEGDGKRKESAGAGGTHCWGGYRCQIRNPSRIRALANSGVSVILLSSDLAETMSLCDTVWTLFHGCVVNTYRTPDEHDKASIIADVVGQEASDDGPNESSVSLKQEWM